MQKKEDRHFFFMCENNSYYKIEWKKSFRNLEQLLLMGSAVHLYRKDIKREKIDKKKIRCRVFVMAIRNFSEMFTKSGDGKKKSAKVQRTEKFVLKTKFKYEKQLRKYCMF